MNTATQLVSDVPSDWSSMHEVIRKRPIRKFSLFPFLNATIADRTIPMITDRATEVERALVTTVGRFEALQEITTELLAFHAMRRRLEDLQREEDEAKFHRLSEWWRRETRFISRVKQMAMHPAYQQIIGMGERALSFLFQELATRGGHWFWALNAITGGEDPAGETADYDEAREAWLNWAEEHGYECQGRSK